MKEAFYFPHDSNAIQDPKMMTLLFECGLSGVGLYWILIEILHQQPCGRIAVAQLTHYVIFYGRHGVPKHDLDKCLKVMFEVGLLVEKGGEIYSERVIKNKQKRHIISEKARTSAKTRWGDANALRTQSEGNAIKERKGKSMYATALVDQMATTGTPLPNQTNPNLIGNNRFEKPTIELVKTYCLERKNSVDHEKWFSYYESNGWRVGKNPMKDWKAAVRTWEKSEYTKTSEPKKREVIH